MCVIVVLAVALVKDEAESVYLCHFLIFFIDPLMFGENCEQKHTAQINVKESNNIEADFDVYLHF